MKRIYAKHLPYDMIIVNILWRSRNAILCSALGIPPPNTHGRVAPAAEVLDVEEGREASPQEAEGR